MPAGAGVGVDVGGSVAGAIFGAGSRVVLACRAVRPRGRVGVGGSGSGSAIGTLGAGAVGLVGADATDGGAVSPGVTVRGAEEATRLRPATASTAVLPACTGWVSAQPAPTTGTATLMARRRQGLCRRPR